jgi:lysophospholipase L1-like esterase
LSAAGLRLIPLVQRERPACRSRLFAPYLRAARQPRRKAPRSLCPSGVGFTIDPTPSRSGISPLVATVMPAYTPHIITLMIGTNDAIDDYQMATAATRLGNLIDSIITALPNALIVVAHIPSQDDALNTRIQTYNAAIPAVIQTRANAGKHLQLVNMYPVIASNASYKTALLNDTWHPNSAGYALMAQVWYSVLGPLLH